VSKSDYLEAQLLNAVLGGGTWTKPGTVYVALFTTAPTDAGGGTEVSGGSYARVAVTNNATNFPNATGTSPTTKANGTTITFPQASANWGTITSFGILDASSAGNLLIHAALNPSKAVNQNDTAEFPPGELKWTED
jgi:hypothetical protein